ncbi:hypothetical protein AYO21_04694 [Fonsecaea monophora]|uniref:Uncharacterized protein n=1 Tax=Fonsecaea monophora TaxID=254056 RepID=A0A177FBP3_9EURO|nr:hypothetical protein AYO21_04694 [Fonsecaea monophora]OAG41081.1 hypothetical protein AYO21_04694 [Fonsecaea monophora]
MARLQKTLKQRQRHAARNSANVTKLTPAEIRSLNNGALTSKTGSQSSSKSTSTQSRSRRSTNATPPTTPDELPAYGAQTHRNSISKNSNVNIPTPPHTPNTHRRSSQSSTHGAHHHGHHMAHSHASGIIHAPRPRGSAQAAFMSANGWSSRPSSSGSSTYRGLPTYRGPEITRTGSLTMLQYPSQKIVSNPLSYFSRPRQSQVSTSPERGRHESPEVSIYRAQSLHNVRSNSVPIVSAPSSRPASPPRVTDSPVSMIVDMDKFPAVDLADDPHNQPKVPLDEEVAPAESSPQIDDAQSKPVTDSPVEPAKETTPPESPKKEKEKQKRFTIHTALFNSRDKSNHDCAETTSKLKKGRRRTLSFSKSKEPDKSQKKAATPVEAIDEVKVDGATIETEDSSTDPATRPLSLIIPSDFKGKEKEIVSAPVYARCACCGKLKRPSGYASELSPVLENENLRTNFSFEIERTSGTSERRASDASRHKFIPIIPMEVGENDTRQATIEPYSGPTTNHAEHEHTSSMDMNIASSSPVKQPIGQPNSSPRRMKRLSTPSRFTRFGSLHGRRNDSAVIAEEDEDAEAKGEAHESQPLLGEALESGANGIVNQIVAAAAAADEQVIATSTPVVEPISSADRAFIEPVPMMATYDSRLLTSEILESVPLTRSRTNSNPEMFSTPIRATTPVISNVNLTPVVTSGLPGALTKAQIAQHEEVEDSPNSDARDETPTSAASTATTLPTATSPLHSGKTAALTFEPEFSAAFFETPDLSLTPKIESDRKLAGTDAQSEMEKDKPRGMRKSTATATTTEWVAEVMTVKA